MDRFADWLLSLPGPARVALFGLIVVAVLALGYLSMSNPATPVAPTAPTPQAPTIPAVPDNPGPADEPATDPGWTLALPVSQPVLDAAAERAVDFAEEFLSYRYDQDEAVKQRRIAQMLADHHSIDLSGLTPTGALRDRLLSSRTVVVAEATHVEAVMVSAAMLGVDVTVEETRTQPGGEPRQETRRYALTLSRDNADWDVSEMYAEGDSPFLDETG